MFETSQRAENDAYIKELAYKTAIEAAIRAGNLVLRHWPGSPNLRYNTGHNMQIIATKHGVGNYATPADLESEGVILDLITAESLFEEHGILTEESDGIRSDSGWQWYIDPLDGTLPFSHGLTQFGISTCLLRGEEPVVGVIAMPALGQLIAARKGHGVSLYSFTDKWLAGLRINDQPFSLGTAMIACDVGYDGRAENYENIFARLSEKVGYIVSYCSSSASNFYLTLGHLSAYVHTTPTAYDIAAASAIITELGGVVTDLRGEPINWQGAQSRSYLASLSPDIHRQVLAAVKGLE